jgi:hypothetical protein
MSDSAANFFGGINLLGALMKWLIERMTSNPS